MAQLTDIGVPIAVRRFRAMNTDINIRTTDPARAPLLVEAVRVFEDVERRFSRFLPESELCALNGRAAERVEVSAEMCELLASAAAMHRVTGGVFDPSILPELEGAGYDRSFELVDGAAARVARAARGERRFGELSVDRDACTVMLPPGLRLDFGGIGKGWAVDRAAAALRPARDYLINAGGDIFAAGSDGYHDGWTAVVAHPHTHEETGVVHLRDQAMATSTTAVRRWTTQGETRHHLIDPRSGTPAAAGVLSASVIAPTTVEADVFAKTALILGEHEGRAFLRSAHCPGLFVLDHGAVAVTPDWPGATQ
jgi:thiamine biosynthesis lipoprotein